MSTPSNIDLAILKRVAKWHQGRGVNPSTVPNNSALAELLSNSTTTTFINYNKPALQEQAVNSLKKKIESLSKGSTPGALKLLRLKQRAERLGLQFEELTNLIKKEAVRLIDRALVLSARHGAKARVRLSTLSALTQAGFIETDSLNAVKTAMMSSDMVKDLLAKTNEEEDRRWKEMCQASSLPASKKKAKKRKPTIINSERRTNGTMPCKPLTKAAFLRSTDGSKKQAIKAERTAKAKARRLKVKANGGTKVGGPGEGVQVCNPNFGLCTAGHIGTKAAK